MKPRYIPVRRTAAVCLVFLLTAVLFLQAHLETGRAMAQTPVSLTLPFPPDRNMRLHQGWYYADGFRLNPPACQGDPAKHCGIDYIRVNPTSGNWESFPVLAAARGTVVIGYSYGNFIEITHSGGVTTFYGHLDRFVVRNGDEVQQGQIIGWSGNSGTPYLHLHFQVKINGSLTDPYGKYGFRDSYPQPNSDASDLTYFNPGPCSGEGVYVYENPDFSGRCQKFTSDSPDWVTWYVGNDEISSLRMVGNWSATLYGNSSYQGASSTLTGDQRDFRSLSSGIGDDNASSIKVARRSGGSSGSGGAGGGGGNAPASCRYGGTPIAFGQTVSNFINASTERVIYCFQANGGTQVVLDMWGHDSALDTIVQLYDSAGSYMDQNDDSDGSTVNSRLSVRLPNTGIYYIVATSYGRTTGQFWLRLNR